MNVSAHVHVCAGDENTPGEKKAFRSTRGFKA